MASPASSAGPGDISGHLHQPQSSAAAAVTDVVVAKVQAPPPDFKLSIAVVMAAAAIEAYMDPSGAQPNLEDRTPRGTHITYMSKEFLLKTFQGALRVTIKNASNLLVGDDANDDRTVISVGKGGSVVHNVGPNWGESFTLYVRDLKTEALKLSSTDDFLFKKDKELGSVEQPLDLFKDGQSHRLDLTLPGKDSKPATVTLDAIFVPFDDETAVAFIADDPPLECVTDKRAPVVGDSSIAAKVARTKAMASGKASILAPPSFQEIFTTLKPEVDGAELLQPIAFLENVFSDTQAYVCQSEKLHSVVVAFRGTEAVKKEDLVSDVRLLRTAFFTPGTPGVTAAQLKVGVHKGFLAAHKSLQDEVSSLVDELTSDGNKGPWQVYIVGHSLGGALATLCTYALVSRPDHASKNQKLFKYTYGEPRVGDEDFAADFNAKQPAAFRMVNPKDVVPRIPYLMGFCHVNTGVYLQEDGSYKFITEPADMPGDGSGIVEIAGLTAKSLLGIIMPWMKKDGKLLSILKLQAQIAESIADGTGVKQHKGLFYQKTLGEAIAHLKP